MFTHTRKNKPLATRRGSTLVLVLGSLGLIAILTVVYVSVGRADRRTAVAAEERTRLRSNADQIIDRALSPVGDDAFATRIESTFTPAMMGPADANFVFEATDFPSTSPGFVSVFPLNIANDPDALGSLGEFRELIARHRFNAQGTITRSWQDPTTGTGPGLTDFSNLLSDVQNATGGLRIPQVDYRTPSDPFLASTLPVDVDADAVRSGDIANAILERRDWAHISNLAPDGRFVNLYNLRDGAQYNNTTTPAITNPWRNALAGRRGGFNAPSGFSLDGGAGFTHTTFGEGQNFLGISDGLTFYQSRTTGGNISGAIAAPYRPTTQYFAPGDTDGTPIFDLVARPELQTFPYLFDTNQREMFRPAVDLPDDIDQGLWANPTYWQYQYADADGDGFVDARWQEMVDASNPRRVVNLAPGGNVRTFFAARVIDLSSLVNVNTATDNFASPLFTEDVNNNGVLDAGEDFNMDGAISILAETRVGATPAEIDLRRILTMEDVWHFTNQADQVGGGGGLQGGDGTAGSYARFVQPQDLDPNLNESVAAGDYSTYGAFDSVSASGIPAAGPLFFQGRASVFAIRQALVELEPPPVVYDNNRREFQEITNPAERLTEGGVFTFAHGAYYRDVRPPYESPATVLGLTIADRAPEYEALRSGYVGDPDSENATLFGVEDLAELLTFWGANDDRITTRLEITLAGRAESNTGTANFSEFASGPLRSDRPTDLELARGDYEVEDDGETNDNYDQLEAATDLLFSVFNSRRYLTTLSGATPRTATRALNTTNSDLVLPSDLEYTARDTRRLLHTGPDAIIPADPSNPANVDAAVRNAFALYADALLPYAGEPGAWSVPSKLTEAYGYNGPEFPLRLAAHLAVNFRDMVDADNTPTARTLRLGNSPTGTANFTELDIGDLDATPGPDQDAQGNPLRPYLTGSTVPPAQQFIDVYGVEKQPFVTEALSFSAYADTPFLNSIYREGDKDWDDQTPLVGSMPPAYGGVVTIDSEVDIDNPDFLFQVFAVQLANPFSTDITLDDTYIEFANQLFIIPDGTVIPAEDFIYVFTTNPTRFEDPDTTADERRRSIEGRVRNATGVPLALNDAMNGFNFLDWLKLQLAGDVNETDPGLPGTKLVELERVAREVLAGLNGDVGVPFYVIDRAQGESQEDPDKVIPPTRFPRPTSRTLGTEGAYFGSFANLFDDQVNAASPGLGEHSFVMLWYDSGTDAIGDDILLDRLSDPVYNDINPVRPTLDTRPIFDEERLNVDGIDIGDDVMTGGQDNSPTNGAITGMFTRTTVAPDEPTIDVTEGGFQGQERVLTTLFARSIRRPTNPMGVTLPPAALPAWTIEVKTRNATGDVPPLNATNDDPLVIAVNDVDGGTGTPEGALDLPDAAVFDGGVSELWAGGIDVANPIATDAFRIGNGMNEILIAQASEYPGDKEGIEIDRENPQLGGLGGQSGGVPDFETRFIEIHSLNDADPSNDEFANGLRVGDTLLPLAVGGYRRDASYTSGSLDARPLRLRNDYTTLSETLALAYGYARFPTPDFLNVTRDLEFEALGGRTGENTVSSDPPRLDLVRLRLDDFVLFNDADGVGGYTPDTDNSGTIDTSEINPDTGRPFDQIRGSGVPAALRVFELATAGGELTNPDLYGTLTRPATGLVNINTAPETVLQTLPFVTSALTISPNGVDDGRSGIQDWANVGGASRRYDFGPTRIDNDALPVPALRDASASIFAYATGIDTPRRPNGPGAPIGNPGGGGLPQPASAALLADRSTPTSADAFLMPPAALSTRANAISNQQWGVASTNPGFLSLGELTAAGQAIDDPDTGAPAHDSFNVGYAFAYAGRDAQDYDLNPNGVPRSLGRNGSGARGIDPFLYAGSDDGIPNDYDEQLVELNAIANSASVRSDFYAMWIVIQGFRESDVTGLDQDDPLVPAFRDRYLVVVDRSNVTRPGDEPRILLRRKLD